MSKSHKSKSSSSTLTGLLGGLDLNEVLNLISTISNKMDNRQKVDNDKILELMKDERFINVISELKKEYAKKEDDSNV